MSSPTQAPDYAATLDRLIAWGEDLARQVHESAGKDITLEQATVAFDRIARAVRRTVHLARHLRERPDAATAARRRTIREVEDTINRRPPGEEPERLHAELRERLDSPELENEFATRPTADIIADILRDLGLAAIPGHPNPWTRRTPADIRALNARATRAPRHHVMPGLDPGIHAVPPSPARPAIPGPAPEPRISPKPPAPGTSPPGAATSAG